MNFRLLLLCIFLICIWSLPAFAQGYTNFQCGKKYVVMETIRYNVFGGTVFLPLENIILIRKSGDSNGKYGMVRVYDGHGSSGRWLKTNEETIDRLMICLKSRIK